VIWIIILWVVLSVAVALAAGRFGRDEMVWLIVSLAISPLIAFILLLALGRRGKSLRA
jgi:hypothetical protein